MTLNLQSTNSMAATHAHLEGLHQHKGSPGACWDKTMKGWQEIWRHKTMQVCVLVVIPLGLYLCKLGTDVALAAEYYSGGHTEWFAWTLGLVTGAQLILHIWSCGFLYLAERSRHHDDSSNFAKVVHISPCVFWCLSSIPVVGVCMHYAVFSLLIWRGSDVSGVELERYLPIIHLLEAVMAAISQLCLQIKIWVVTDERVSVLKVVSMVISLVVTVKAVVTYLYYKSNLHRKTLTRGLVGRLVFMTFWKVLEVSVRVLTMGLFASAFAPWIALRIGLHWLVMTAAFFAIDRKLKGIVGLCAWGLAMVVDSFSMTFSPDHRRTFWLNSALTLLGNITMVTVWYTQKAGQDWYDVPALVGIVAGSVVSAGFGFIGMVLNGRIESPVAFCRGGASGTETAEQNSPSPDSGNSVALNSV
ncbi:XK-related protein 6-like [Branchiostoma lanceolatum]|uniref:XK-related protein 6-like n=1 Tax=Branchiostoma lanceolatum TaxID=7740 RepID=UPI003455D43C